MKPVIAIVGRPNVGKSMLFNKLTGNRTAIVEDTPGVTRDRIYGECEWRNRVATVIDTGGIEPQANTEILKFMREQAEIAVRHADVIILVTDVTVGVTSADMDVANMLLRFRKPVFVAVNKVDGIGAMPPEIYEFYNLGAGDPYPISALHGHGTGDLLDAVYDAIEGEEEEEEEDHGISVAIIGKPNAGKSSLLNCILGEKRVIVSDIPGTTRDSIDAVVENQYGKFTWIDTAGIRRKSKVDETVEKYSVLRALMAMDRADVCVLMIDATEGVTEQDTKVAGYAHEKGKAIIIAINKWDLVEKETKTMDKMREKVYTDLAYLTYAPIIFISAKTGQRVPNLYPMICEVYACATRRITTGMLNEVLGEATAKVQPPTDKGKRLKIYYMTQTGISPPTFVVFCNSVELFHFSYRRYLENTLREVFGIQGTPIRMLIREKNDKTDVRDM
ncbi:MAG: ribosome biogenesis GTPase Der [Ruminococcaceae bacterium]|nr:ribosome biogenesis GTPase Der [Oscillospiraceae bacterium]